MQMLIISISAFGLLERGPREATLQQKLLILYSFYLNLWGTSGDGLRTAQSNTIYVIYANGGFECIIFLSLKSLCPFSISNH